MNHNDPELSRLYSLYGLLDRYYEAKRTYYEGGRSNLTDQEFDALESSIHVIHPDALKKHGCVGYDADKHLNIKALRELYTTQFISLFHKK